MKSALRKFFLKVIVKVIGAKNGNVVFYNSKEDRKIFDLIRSVKKTTEMLMSDPEAYQVYTLVLKTLKIEGDIAEVGTYKGGSSKLIAEVKGKKTLHLFDTFEGLPEISLRDDPGHFHKDQFQASYEAVQNLMKSYPNVFLYKGIFPETAGPIKDKRFSFINLDVDIYESTLSCLNFFYPRLNKGGVILSHDYPKAIGVKKAFDDFFSDKPEIVIEVASKQQCMVVKV